MKKFPIYTQCNTKDSTAACIIKMIADNYGQSISFEEIKSKCTPSQEGSSLSDIARMFNEVGYDSFGSRVTVESLQERKVLPCVIPWSQKLFVILYKIRKKNNDTIFYVADPAKGLVSYHKDEFMKHWRTTRFGSEHKGIILNIDQK